MNVNDSTSGRPRLLIVSNLYPLPTEVARGMFNKQQFDRLSSNFDVTVMVPVAWPEWFKNFRLFTRAKTPKLIFFPQFYTPKVGRSLYGVWMTLSLFGAWLFMAKAKRFDLCLGSWAYPDAFATYWIAKLFRVPFVMKVHGSDLNEYLEYPARKRQIAYIAKRSNGVLCVSQALAQRLYEIDVSPSIVKVVYNGVDAEKFFPFDQNTQKKHLLFIGNLKESKGVVDLMRAFLRIQENEPELRLIIAGAGPAAQTLRS
ncbi:MAG: glycosyltransferase, partial [Pseudomonadales bacterium]|nr:glycosyltransferase [Pseudomonadales bacterium]